MGDIKRVITVKEALNEEGDRGGMDSKRVWNRIVLSPLN